MIRRSDVLQLLRGGDAAGYKPSALREMVQQLPNALPCELGAPLYCVILDDGLQENNQRYIVREKVSELLITADGVLVGTGDGCYDKPGEFLYGCGVFLSEEEAKAEVQKLERGESGGN